MRKKTPAKQQRLRPILTALYAAAAAACSAAVPARAPTLHTPAPEIAVEPVSTLEANVERGLLPAVRVEGEPIQSAVLLERMAALKVPGLSIAVFDEAGVVWAKGYGLTDVASEEKVGPGTLFQAGSISKSVKCACAPARRRQRQLRFGSARQTSC